MILDQFFATHPVFTLQDFSAFLAAHNSANPRTRQALLRYHQGEGHILPIRRGLYASVPISSRPEGYPVDPFLVASRLADDAVLAYHAALAFHGVAHSMREEFVVISNKQLVRPLAFQGVIYRAVEPPAALRHTDEAAIGIVTGERNGLALQVTSLERTLVDVLDRPELAGGWEEIWRSFEGVPYLAVDKVVQYALLIGSATVIATVGYYLEQQSRRYGITPAQLAPLRHAMPRTPHYLERQTRPSRLIAAWNLVVPLAFSHGKAVSDIY